MSILDAGEQSPTSIFYVVVRSLFSYLPLNQPIGFRSHRKLPVLLCLLLVLVACGPEETREETDLVADTIQIAEDYVQTGDIERARVLLQTLDVANSTQWLLYVAETAIANHEEPSKVDPLVQLVLALGLQTGPVLAYAEEQNFATGQLAVSASVSDSSLAVIAVAAPTATPISAPLAATPVVEEPASQEPAPAATNTSVPIPQVRTSNDMNVRGGPGTNYPVVGAVEAGAQAEIIGKNTQSDWWQVLLPSGAAGWVYGPLVEASGNVASVSVITDIPAPPPTPVPAPVVEESVPEPEPEAPAPAAAEGPDFRMVERRLWDVYENGGSLSGPTVTCGGKHELIVKVIDANGAPLNGVAVQGLYGAQEVFVTGVQGKGDGLVEFILWKGGQDVKVIRDTDGRDVSSETAVGMTSDTRGISYSDLIAGRYCTDDASCKKFATPDDQPPGCFGHFSWSVTFQRKY